MRFTEPLYLLLLLPTLAYLFWSARSLRAANRARRATALVLRTLVTLLLVLALAGLQNVRTNRGVATMFVLDKSASMGGQANAQAEAFIKKALEAQTSEDKSGLVVFGNQPVTDVQVGSLANLGKIYAAPDPSASDIAAALRLATASFPEGLAKRIVLLSDGNETASDANQAALVAATDGVQIDAVRPAVDAAPRAEVIVGDVTTPSSVTKGEPFEMRVNVQATAASAGVLRIDRDGIPVARVPVKLSSGTNSVVVSQLAPTPGFYRYRAVLESAQDSDARNNAGIAYVAVKGKPRVLLVDGTPGAGNALRRAMNVYDIDVKQGGAELLPTRVEEVQEYDAVLFNDFSADNLSDGQMKLLATAVRESGVGFGMIGGENSFLSGGYYETPIADVLPVDLNIRQRKVFPSTTILIVMDASGSMGMIEDGQQKLKIAASAAAATVRMMSPRDFVGAAGSSDAIEYVAPIQPAANKERIAAAIGTVGVNGGGIYAYPSLEFAFKELRKRNTRVRHLILLADGNDTDTQEGCLQLANRMVAEKMTITMVSIGDGKDIAFLKELARVGRGNYFAVKQAKQLQRMFTRDAAMMSRSAIEEGAFLPKVDAGDPILQGLSLRTIPPLFAYNLASDRPLARTIMRTGKDDPLLATWQYGLGTSLAFTSDAQTKWARQWVGGWRDFNAFWAQSVRALMRQASNNRLSVTTRRESGRAVVQVEAFDKGGQPINNLNAKVNALTPDGSAQSLAIRQIGPGRYEGTFDTPQTGGYVLSVAENIGGGSAGATTGGGGKAQITRAGFALAYPPEYQAIRPNTVLLEQVAQATGGKLLTNPIDVFRRPERPGRAIRDLWPELLTVAAVLFLLDIAFRRVALPLSQIVAAISGATGKILRRAPRITTVPQQAQAVATLQQAARRGVRDGRGNGNGGGNGASPTSAAPTPFASPSPDNPATPAATSTTGHGGGTTAGERLLELKRRQK